MEIVNQRENVVAGAGVEVAGGLVGQDDRRVDRQRARNGDALPLAARQLLGQMVRRAAPSWTSVSSSRGALVHLAARPAAQVQRQADVLETGQRRQQVEELKDEADLVAPQPRQVIVGEAAERLAVDATRAPRWGGRGRRSD